MPLYMDRHALPGATAADIATAHLRDLEVQERFGVRFVTYWFEEEAGSGFCLIEGPDKESVEAAHRASHAPSYPIAKPTCSLTGGPGRKRVSFHGRKRCGRPRSARSSPSTLAGAVSARRSGRGWP